MFYKIKTQKTKLKIILAGILLFASTGLAQAWWPQTEPHASGITRVTNPAGLPYASFNNFTDNNNPESSLNDERYFVVVQNYTNSTGYMNNVYAEPGDVVLALAFIHNNGYLNDPAVTATGVRTGMGGFHEENGVYVTNPDTEIIISQYIASTNATPAWIWDEFTVTSETGNPIRLRASSSLDIQSDYTSSFFPTINSDNLFLTGQSIGDPDSGYTSGTFKGCMENAMYTFVYFQVEDASGNIPPSCEINAAPTTIDSWDSSTLTWTSTGATTANIDQWIGGVSVDGNQSVSPITATTYTMTVTGSGGTATCSDTVNVNTPISSPVCTLVADPTSVLTGGSSILTWTSSGATSAVLSTGTGNVALSGTQSVLPTATTTYTLTAIGTGGSVTCSETVSVSSSSSSSSSGGSSSSSSSSSSGGSSSSSGGWGNWYVNLNIEKMISTNGRDYFDADTAAAALLLKNAQRNIVFYKVILENNTSVELANVEISDVFDTQKSLIQQLLVRNVKEAIYDNGIFTIEKIEKKEEVFFTYQATLNTNSINENSSAYNQVEVMDYEMVGGSQYRKKTGQKDRTYVIVPVKDVDRTLRKYSNKNMINDGDEVIYTIFFKNKFDYDLHNVILTDDYDENRLEILSAPGKNNGSTLEFKRTIVRPGQSVIFRYTAKGINKWKEAVKARNVVKIFTNTVDLSKERAERTITIYPYTAKRRLLQTGAGHVLLIVFSLATTTFIIHRRKFT